MWKFLVFNALWFMVIIAANFRDEKIWRAAVLLAIAAAAGFTAALGRLDPFGWLFYVVFSLVTTWSARQFRRWALAGPTALEEDIAVFSRKGEMARKVLGRKSQETDALEQQANEIIHLYDKVKEMSQSLDMLEMFLVLGEALSKKLSFSSIKLALFDEERPEPGRPAEFFELHRSDFEGVFDKGPFLRDRSRAKAELYPFDRTLFELAFKERKMLHAFESADGSGGPPYIAQPIFIHEKIFAVLVLLGTEKKDVPVISILTDRFASEAQRVKLYEKVETLAITDGLTGVYVRRHLVERFQGELERSKRFGFKLSFLMIDIDNFKRFNDQFGHLVGDVVLRQTAETIKKSVREIDLAGRYGGEEFGVLLIETDESGAFFVAERIRRAVAERVFNAYDESLKVTVSIGCATLSSAVSEADVLIDAADSALYQAKRQGRNKVCSYSLPE
ncbi:MAG: GGDEF domain-containing protein [Candidatus Omnitrophota bacterium]